MRRQIMPLALAPGGRQLSVKDVRGGWGLRQKMADMGLTPGTQLRVVSGCHPGPLLIDVRGTRLGIGFGVAQKILVEEADNV